MPDVIESVSGELFTSCIEPEAGFGGSVDVFIRVFVAEKEAVRPEPVKVSKSFNIGKGAELLKLEGCIGCIGGNNGELLASEPDFG